MQAWGAHCAVRRLRRVPAADGGSEDHACAQEVSIVPCSYIRLYE